VRTHFLILVVLKETLPRWILSQARREHGDMREQAPLIRQLEHAFEGRRFAVHGCRRGARVSPLELVLPNVIECDFGGVLRGKVSA
jgi:hypothetical protein